MNTIGIELQENMLLPVPHVLEHVSHCPQDDITQLTGQQLCTQALVSLVIDEQGELHCGWILTVRVLLWVPLPQFPFVGEQELQVLQVLNYNRNVGNRVKKDFISKYRACLIFKILYMGNQQCD